MRPIVKEQEGSACEWSSRNLLPARDAYKLILIVILKRAWQRVRGEAQNARHGMRADLNRRTFFLALKLNE